MAQGPDDADRHASADAVGRVALVSSRPMFLRSFGKLLRILREDVEVTTAPDLQGLDRRAREGLVLLDAGAADAARVGASVAAARAVVPRVVIVLDEAEDATVEAAMAAGASGVMVKSVPPGVVAEWLGALLDGEIVRPAPSVALDPDALPESLRRRLSARRQKLLRLQLGGHSISATARELGLTPARVIGETRVVMDIVRGHAEDS